MFEGVRQISTSREHITAMGQAARALAETCPAMMDEVVYLYIRLIAERAVKAGSSIKVS